MKRKLTQMMVMALVLCQLLAKAQIRSVTDWHLVKEGEGIQVYTAPIGETGRKYIKVSTGLDGTLQGVKQVFRDIGGQKDWVYSTKKAYLVQKTDDNHLLYYNETNLPWPASNRDVLIRMKLEESTDHHNLTITQVAEPTAAPVNKGIVRISHLSGYWQFREENEGRLHVDYYLDVDPAGSLPNWVVNHFIAKGPYETFVKLKELVKKRP